MPRLHRPLLPPRFAYALRGLRWLLFSAACVLVAAYAFLFFRLNPPDPGNSLLTKFALSGLDVPLHFFGAGLALLLVPVQASGWIRRRWPAVHRAAGWVFVGGLGGASLALDAHGGPVARTGFSVLAVLWLSVTAIGLRHALVRDFARHRRWMVHSLAMAFGAVTLRIILFTGIGPLGLPFETVYAFAAWASWLLNMAACEAWMRWGPRPAGIPLNPATRRRAAPATHSASAR